MRTSGTPTRKAPDFVEAAGCPLRAASSASSSETVVLHRKAIAEAPAEIRRRAKRGDKNIHITDS